MHPKYCGVWHLVREESVFIPVRRAELVLDVLSHSQERLPEPERQEQLA